MVAIFTNILALKTVIFLT